MTEEELARAVAQDIGGEAIAETNAELSREKTRSFGEFLIDAATVGGFIAQTAQLALQLHASGKSPAELLAALQAKAASAVRIAGDVQQKIIQAIVAKLTGSK